MGGFTEISLRQSGATRLVHVATNSRERNSSGRMREVLEENLMQKVRQNLKKNLKQNFPSSKHCAPLKGGRVSI